jgi:predicted DCC family thiol-disulfide oxidoreductase YuxK
MVVVYDAGCGLCTAAIGWLRSRDRSGILSFVPGTDADALARLGVDAETASRTVVVVEPASGRRWIRAEAVGRALRVAPGGWLPGSILRVRPLRFLADRIYDAVAARRHRISARLGLAACGAAGHPGTARTRRDR